MKTLRAALAIGLAMVTLGCGGDDAPGGMKQGVRLKDEQLCMLRVGGTTKEQAIALLGTPTMRTETTDAALFSWTYIELKNGAMAATSEDVTLSFGPSVLERVSVTGRAFPACLKGDGGAP